MPAIIRLRVVSVSIFFRSGRFSLDGVSTRSELPVSPEDARNRFESGPSATGFEPVLPRSPTWNGPTPRGQMLPISNYGAGLAERVTTV